MLLGVCAYLLLFCSDTITVTHDDKEVVKMKGWKYNAV